MMRSWLKAVFALGFAACFASCATSLNAQTLVPPPPVGPAPQWLANYPTDPGGWTSPEAACEAQRDYFNPNATLLPITYGGGRTAGCNWASNPNSNTIRAALVTAYCPPGWLLVDTPACIRPDYTADSRAQCNCENAPVNGTPFPTVGNPVALNHAAKVDKETDYSTADGLFSVERKYYSLPEDYGATVAPTGVPGFGARWHGLVPGRLVVYGGSARFVQYMDTTGNYSTFDSDDFRDPLNWNWHSYGATRIRLYGVNSTSSSKTEVLYEGVAVPGAPAELKMEMFNGEYILFRRFGPPSDRRYMIPVERGFPDGYKIFYNYADSSEFPSGITDSLGRQMTLTWADADRLSYPSFAASWPMKVISEIALPDTTKLKYTYGYAADARGSQIKDRLEKVQRLSSLGVELWARSYLHENPTVPYAITGKVDQNGNRLSTYSYDAAGLVASTELAGGFQKYSIVNLEVEGDGRSFWRQVTNPLGHRTDYHFFKDHPWGDAQRVLKNVKEYADTGIEATTTTYDYYGYVGDMFIANYYDEKNRTLYSQIGAGQKPTLVREASGTADARTTNYTWDSVFDLPTRVERTGLRTEYSYSPTGLLMTKTLTDTTAQTVPYSTAGQTRSWVYSWNGNGRLLSIDGPKGNDVNGKNDVTSFTYDASGNLLTSTNGLGHITQFSNYDANGRPGKMTDPSGVDTLYTYDALGRLTTITVKNPTSATDTAVTTLEYDVEGRVIAITAPATQKIAIDRDLAGQVVAVRATGGEKTTFTYDPMGNVTNEAVKRANGTTARQVLRTFDGLGRLLSETLGTNRTSRFAYDVSGNQTQIISARSNATVQAFDPLDRLISSVAPDTGDSRSSYDAYDRTTTFIDPNAVQTSYVRNGFGDVIQEVSPDRGTSTYYYDAAGDMTASVDGRGQRVDIVRDALGRVLSKTPAGRPASEIVSYGYDTNVIAGSYSKGRLVSVTDGTGVTQFKYDYRGNILTKLRQSGALAATSLKYTYDKADRILTITYPSGRTVTYTRDTSGRVTSVKTSAGTGAPTVTLVSGITYEPFGSMLAATFGNGLKFAQSWGNDGRLASKRLFRTTGGANLSLLTYGYDNDDNITSIADGVDATRSVTYGYDSVGRLAQAVLASGGARRQDFLHDRNGNRTRVEQRVNPNDATPLATATYALNAGTNRLASIADASGTRTISYDGRGNTVGEVRPDASITVQYDGYGRLTSYLKTGTAALVNGYNGLDERVSAGTVIDPRNYVFDGDGRMIGEYGATVSDVKAETIWLSPEVDTPNQPLGGDDGVDGYAPLAVVTGGAVYWVHGNHLGVPTVITNSAGAAAAPTGYTAVGFPGQTRTLADLYYNRYRDYDPTTGRYIQADPIGLAGGNNPYLYAEGNPVRWTDPMGLNPWLFRRAWVTGEVAGQALSWWCLRNIALCMRTIGPTAIRVANACKAVSKALGGGDRCDELNNDVQRAKERVGSLGKCRVGMSSSQLQQRRIAWLELAIARARRDEVCWDGGNYGHQQAQADAWMHAGNCSSMLQ